MDTRGVIIRQFTPADISQATVLEKGVYGSGAYSYYYFRQLYDLFPTLLWVAERDETVVGHICGAIGQDFKNGWVLNFAVQAHFRRQGVGRRLLQACVDSLLAVGATRIRTTAVPDNVAGIKLCKSLGFTEAGIEIDYYGDGTDRLILERV